MIESGVASGHTQPVPESKGPSGVEGAGREAPTGKLTEGSNGHMSMRHYISVAMNYGAVPCCYGNIVLAGMNCNTDATAQ